MGTSTITDTELLGRAHDGDLDALRLLIEEHLHPAWRIAMVAAPDPSLAAGATVNGFCDGLQAAHRHPDPQIGLRVRLVAATRHAALATSAADLPTAPPDSDPVVGAFRALPEQWRTALWMIEVEGGTPEQIAPILGLNRTASAALADRAAAGLRDRLAHDVADRVAEPDCARALAKLPAHAAGKLTASERDAVGTHLATCGNCAVWIAALVSPRPALRRLIASPPDLTADVEARWLELLDRNNRGILAPLTERAIGAAAAAVLAMGLGGAALLGGRDRGDVVAELAVPAGATPAPDTAATGDSVDVGAVTVPTSGGATGSSSNTTSGAASKPTNPDTTTARSFVPETDTPAQPTPVGPVTPPPAPNPPPDTAESNDVAIDLLGGTVAIGLGECTGIAIAGTPIGCAPETSESSAVLDVKVPGLPEIGL